MNINKKTSLIWFAPYDSIHKFFNILLPSLFFFYSLRFRWFYFIASQQNDVRKEFLLYSFSLYNHHSLIHIHSETYIYFAHKMNYKLFPLLIFIFLSRKKSLDNAHIKLDFHHQNFSSFQYIFYWHTLNEWMNQGKSRLITSKREKKVFLL